MLPSKIRDEINSLLGHLIEAGLSVDQNFAEERHLPDGTVEVAFSNASLMSVGMKSYLEYHEIYKKIIEARAYSVMLPDGGILQMTYLFRGRTVQRHRLCFFSSPDLEEFQNNPDVYLVDELYAEVVARNVVPFPFRFDYDRSDRAHRVLDHPKCHFVLGQYKNCRMPVTAPVTPSWFVDFVLRNFYHTAFLSYADGLPASDNVFEECIHTNERGVIHLQVPLGVRVAR